MLYSQKNTLKLGKTEVKKSGWEARVRRKLKTQNFTSMKNIHLFNVKGVQTPRYHPSDSRLRLK